MEKEGKEKMEERQVERQKVSHCKRQKDMQREFRGRENH